MNLVPLDYGELYGVAEELAQLRGAQLQGVFQLSKGRYGLDMRVPGQSRWIVLDLTPARPFIVSITSTKTKTSGAKSPVYNFIRAHFQNLILESVEMAQKPNRTVRLTFRSQNDTNTMTFKCFPHGQHLILRAGDKLVNFPWRPSAEWEHESLAFVEVDALVPDEPGSTQWIRNERLAASVFKNTSGIARVGAGEGAEPRPGGASFSSGPEGYRAKLIRKVEKAISGIDQGMAIGKGADSDKIAELQAQADAIKSVPEVNSAELERVYAEIKRIKRKALIVATRRNDLVAQLERLRNEEIPLPQENERFQQQAEHDQRLRKKGEEPFSGTRIVIDSQWQLWVGRNAWQNDDLLRLAAPQDTWIHLRDYPGAHGLLRGPKKATPSPGHLDFACRVVAILSQSKKNPFAEGDKLDFIVTERKFVKKKKGEAPGKVIVERENVRRVAFKDIKFDVS